MDKVKETLQKNTAILDPYAAMVPAFVDVSAKAGVNPGLILGGVASVVLLILMILQGWAILLITITVLYPAVYSIRAIESPEEDDDKVWLTYWMVFGLFTVAETFFGFIFYFIPYWEWIRLVFFLWLMLPQFEGAKKLYDGVIRNLMATHKDQIAYWINKTTSVAADAQKDAMAQAKQAASDPSLLVKGMELSAKAQEAMKEDAPEEPQVEEAQ